jgi:hypothetical protein
MLAQVGGLAVLAVAPWAAVILGLLSDFLPHLIVGTVTVAAHLLFSLYCVENRPKDTLSLLLFPMGLLLIAAMLLRAGYKCIKNGGIEWRGTHYPLAQLRRGQRVRFLAIWSQS